MPELETQSVRIDPNAINSRIMLPNVVKAALKQHGYTDYLLQGNERIFVLKKQVMDMPVIVLNFLQKDRRYEHFILEVIEAEPVAGEPEPGTETVPEIVVTEDPVVEVEPLTDDSFDHESLFTIWEREDIETAKLNGDEGLKSYVDYHGIDLAGNKLASDVRNAVLEWYDTRD